MKKTIIICVVTFGLLFSQAALARPGGRGSKDRPARKNQAQTQTQTRTTKFNKASSKQGSAKQAASSRARLRDQMSSQQQSNLSKLEQDLKDIKAGSQVTDQQKQDLANSMTTLVKGTTKPSQESVDQLSSHLSSAVDDGNLTKAEQVQLAQDVAVVLNSANIPPEEVQAVISDVEQILISSGVDQSDVALVVSDLQSISQELQSNLNP